MIQEAKNDEQDIHTVYYAALCAGGAFRLCRRAGGNCRAANDYGAAAGNGRSANYN